MSLKTDCFVLLLVKHPSRDGDAVYRIKIAAEVLVFIRNCRALVLRRGDFHHVACWIRPYLQVTFIDVIGRIPIG